MKAEELKYNLSRFSHYFSTTRGLGNTHSLLNVVISNPLAILVVSDYNTVRQLNKILGLGPESCRIISISELNKLKGKTNYFLLFDNEVLRQIFAGTLEQLKYLDALEKEQNEL